MTWAAAHTAFLFLRVQEKKAKEYTLRRSPAGSLHLCRQQADGPKLANAQTAVHLYRLLPATFRLRHEGDWGASANLGRHMGCPYIQPRSHAPAWECILDIQTTAKTWTTPLSATLPSPLFHRGD